MRKREILCVFAVLIVLIFTMGVLGAETNDTSADKDSTEKAYDCLTSKVGNRTDLSLQEAIFATLALGYQKNLLRVIEDNEKTSEHCWPKGGCKLQDTAQVALAYERIGKNTDDIAKWLISNNATPTELKWFLEIDISSHKSALCKIKYKGHEYSVSILDNMKLSGNAGTCLELAAGNYWLAIKSNCLKESFDISCNQDFVTTLLYQKNSGGTIYVSPNTHSAASLGTTTEKPNTNCFKTSGGCSYEGSLWASLALYTLGKDVSSFTPYLLALAEENERFLPSAFLYIITGGNDQYAKIIESQKQGKYWQQPGSSNSRFYDTSLAMLALSKASSTELENAKSYLTSIQTKEGCWNNDNVKDTAFVLYSAWARAVQKSIDTGAGGSGIELCATPNSCESARDCTDAGGQIYTQFDCSTWGEFCCSKSVQKQTCNALGGIVCKANERCSGQTKSAFDGSCCMTSCLVIDDNVCEQRGNYCRTSCEDNEKEAAYTCTDSAKVCCEYTAESTASSSSSTWWIVILVILIILVVLAIVFREKIKIAWYKAKGKASSAPLVKPGMGPGAGGAGFRPPMMMARRPPPGGMPMIRRPMPRPGINAALDETMKKLKQMGG